MPAHNLETQIRVRPGIAIIDLHGEIDALAEDALNTTYAAATASNPRAVLLNFGHIAYINSTGIALIVGLLARARKANCRVFTCGLSDHYVEIFRITRLSDFVTLCEDEASAVAEMESIGK